ncbi:hypothetical protein IscW_ISCW023759, partial [Ixodes scapularis]
MTTTPTTKRKRLSWTSVHLSPSVRWRRIRFTCEVPNSARPGSVLEHDLQLAVCRDPDVPAVRLPGDRWPPGHLALEESGRRAGAAPAHGMHANSVRGRTQVPLRRACRGHPQQARALQRTFQHPAQVKTPTGRSSAARIAVPVRRRLREAKHASMHLRWRARNYSSLGSSFPEIETLLPSAL